MSYALDFWCEGTPRGWCRLRGDLPSALTAKALARETARTCTADRYLVLGPGLVPVALGEVRETEPPPGVGPLTHRQRGGFRVEWAEVAGWTEVPEDFPLPALS